MTVDKVGHFGNKRSQMRSSKKISLKEERILKLPKVKYIKSCLLTKM